MTEIMCMSAAATAAAVKRLRKSKQYSTGEDFRQGINAGRCWGANIASYRQLQVLVDVGIALGDRSGKRQDEDAGNDLAWAMALRLQLRYGEVHAPSEMKRQLFPGPERRWSPAFVEGFIFGAHDVWQEVNKPAKSKKAAV